MVVLARSFFFIILEVNFIEDSHENTVCMHLFNSENKIY